MLDTVAVAVGSECTPESMWLSCSLLNSPGGRASNVVSPAYMSRCRCYRKCGNKLGRTAGES